MVLNKKLFILFTFVAGKFAVVTTGCRLRVLHDEGTERKEVRREGAAVGRRLAMKGRREKTRWLSGVKVTFSELLKLIWAEPSKDRSISCNHFFLTGRPVAQVPWPKPKKK